MSDTKNLPWIEKYRPSRLDDVAGHEGIVKTVRKFVEKRQIPHLLFYGPPGTGKTSTIVAIAKEIYGDKYRNLVLELNASDDRGIDVVREQIKTFASTRQLYTSGFKLIILDEADSMTSVAQNALRRVIEKYSAHTRFCILANYTHKLNPALMSRTTRFRFSPISPEAVRSRIDHVVAEEKVNISPEALDAVVTLAGGDMRKALNVLQSTHARIDGTIEPHDIYDTVGAPNPVDVERIVQSLLNDDWEACLATVSRIKLDKGLALADVLTSVAEVLMGLETPAGFNLGKSLDGLSEIEWRLSNGGNEKIQTSGMIGAIKTAIS